MSVGEIKLSNEEKKVYNRILTKFIRQEQSKLKQLDQKYEKGDFTVDNYRLSKKNIRINIEQAVEQEFIGTNSLGKRDLKYPINLIIKIFEALVASNRLMTITIGILCSKALNKLLQYIDFKDQHGNIELHEKLRNILRKGHEAFVEIGSFRGIGVQLDSMINLTRIMGIGGFEETLEEYEYYVNEYADRHSSYFSEIFFVEWYIEELESLIHYWVKLQNSYRLKHVKYKIDFRIELVKEIWGRKYSKNGSSPEAKTYESLVGLEKRIKHQIELINFKEQDIGPCMNCNDGELKVVKVEKSNLKSIICSNIQLKYEENHCLTILDLFESELADERCSRDQFPQIFSFLFVRRPINQQKPVCLNIGCHLKTETNEVLFKRNKSAFYKIEINEEDRELTNLEKEIVDKIVEKSLLSEQWYLDKIEENFQKGYYENDKKYYEYAKRMIDISESQILSDEIGIYSSNLKIPVDSIFRIIESVMDSNKLSAGRGIRYASSGFKILERMLYIENEKGNMLLYKKFVNMFKRGIEAYPEDDIFYHSICRQYDQLISLNLRMEIGGADKLLEKLEKYVESYYKEFFQGSWDEKINLTERYCKDMETMALHWAKLKNVSKLKRLKNLLDPKKMAVVNHVLSQDYGPDPVKMIINKFNIVEQIIDHEIIKIEQQLGGLKIGSCMNCHTGDLKVIEIENTEETRIICSNLISNDGGEQCTTIINFPQKEAFVLSRFRCHFDGFPQLITSGSFTYSVKFGGIPQLINSALFNPSQKIDQKEKQPTCLNLNCEFKSEKSRRLRFLYRYSTI